MDSNNISGKFIRFYALNSQSPRTLIMKTKRILFLTLLFVLDSISPVIASGFAYIKNVNLEGFTCPTLSTHFNETSLSKIQCLSRCAESSSCYGAFHDQENLLCVGCGDRFLTSKSAPALTGMRYYQRSSESTLITYDNIKLNYFVSCITSRVQCC